jgi:hypothetical protein
MTSSAHNVICAHQDVAVPRHPLCTGDILTKAKKNLNDVGGRAAFGVPVFREQMREMAGVNNPR